MPKSHAIPIQSSSRFSGKERMRCTSPALAERGIFVEVEHGAPHRKKEKKDLSHFEN